MREFMFIITWPCCCVSLLIRAVHTWKKQITNRKRKTCGQQTPLRDLSSMSAWFTVYLCKRPQPSCCGWSTEGRRGSVWDAEPGCQWRLESPGARSSGGTGHRPHAAPRRPGAGLGGDRGPSSGHHPPQYRQGNQVPLIEILVPSAAQIS